MQEANEYAVYSLTEAGYDGSQLQAVVAVRPADARSTGPITQRMSKERIELLARANTHGKKFFATGGSHVCSDDFFKAQALAAREDKLAEQEWLKKTLQLNAELAKKGMAILVEKAACFELNQYKDVSTKDRDLLLQWYDVPKEKMKKADKVAKWREIRASNTPPSVLVGWTEEDKAELERMANNEIDMSDTTLEGMPRCRRRTQLQQFLISPMRSGSH